MSVAIRFTKMVGTGNDFIVVDHRTGRTRALRRGWRSISRALCDRHRGVGADGVLLLEPSSAARARMRVFNPDGSEAQMCGNGARCVALYMASTTHPSGTWDMGHGTKAGKAVTIETKAGVLSATVRGERVALRMTDPTDLQRERTVHVGAKRIRFGFVDTGVPHVVVSVQTLDAVDVQRIGRALREHRQFAPQGTNVNFIQADARHPHRIQIRTYERGVEAETLACGTGVAAAAVMHALEHTPAGRGQAVLANGHTQTHRVDVKTRSGDVLTVSFDVAHDGARAQVRNVVLEGPASRVFDGVVGWRSGRLR